LRKDFSDLRKALSGAGCDSEDLATFATTRDFWKDESEATEAKQELLITMNEKFGDLVAAMS
jgi:hypothetical protein